MLRLNLIGPGRVGQTLARLWTQAGVLQLQAVLGRDTRRSQALVQSLGQGSACTHLAQMPPADVWLLAVPDTQIAPVAGQLAQAMAMVPPQAAGTARPPSATAAPPQAWHCSGFLPAAELAPLQALGWSIASVHPALSFADVDTACAQFSGSVCALEGDAAACARAQTLLQALGGRCFSLSADDKPLYHAAAVFASNFLPVLQAVATELWQGTGVPPDWVDDLARGFVQRAAANVAALGPRQALTGPAARGDTAVLQRQQAALAARDTVLAEAYRALSTLAGRLARDGRSLG